MDLFITQGFSHLIIGRHRFQGSQPITPAQADARLRADPYGVWISPSPSEFRLIREYINACVYGE